MSILSIEEQSKKRDVFAMFSLGFSRKPCFSRRNMECFSRRNIEESRENHSEGGPIRFNRYMIASNTRIDYFEQYLTKNTIN